MKKLLAMLLSLVMVFALVSAASAEGEDFTMVIKGGEVNENLERVDDEYLLAVDVLLTGTVKDTLVALTFDLTFDPEQITFVTMEKNEDLFNSSAVNDTVEGQLRIGLTSEGVVVGEEEPVAVLYFRVAEGLEAGTEIAFELGEEAVAETFADDPKVVTPHDVAADFAPYIVSESAVFNGVVEFNEGEVEYKSNGTPFVMWDHEAGVCEPAFTVYEEDGVTVVDPANYDFEYKENKQPGTGYLFVYFKGAYAGEVQLFFKIYLPATTWTNVENVKDGILVEWTPVEDAAGYVIYRRAWSSTTNGWTSFERWNNTTESSWIDTKVYAGTRYQYGVKAYFARRMDPVAGYEIGGNVNEPTGNYNLGNVGPLKTTVRISSRVLDSVTPGTKQMTVKWVATKYFTGIRVQYAEDAEFTKNCKEVKVAFKLDEDGNAVSPVPNQEVIKGLTSGKTYYVRVCSYHIFEGTTYYGEWSNVLDCKVK